MPPSAQKPAPPIPMQRIAILGCSGAGKSTLARRLGRLLGLPVYHLDALFWQPGWVMSSGDRQVAIQAEIVARDAWIIDGNYSTTQGLRLPRADTVIFLDFPRWLCLWRIAVRIARTFGRVRPDMAPGCPEQIDAEFLAWVWSFRARSRAKTLQAIQRHAPGKSIFILKTPRQVVDFLQSRRPAPALAASAHAAQGAFSPPQN